MSTTKQDVELLLNKLPENCSVEDIQYHLYVLDKVRRGLEMPGSTEHCPRKKSKPALANGLPSSLVATRLGTI